jgi:hypothetical protein
MKFIELYFQLLPYGLILVTAGLMIGVFKFKNFIKPAVIVVLAAQVFKVGLEIFGTYYLWHNNSMSKLLLPPYQKINYFIGYVNYHFILPILLPIIIGLVLFFVIKLINKFFQGRFFHNDEHLMVFYGIILVGNPLWIVYIFSVLFLGFLVYILGLIFKKVNFGERFSLKYLWIPLAFIIFIFSELITKILPVIKNFKL